MSTIVVTSFWSKGCKPWKTTWQDTSMMFHCGPPFCAAWAVVRSLVLRNICQVLRCLVVI